MRTFDLAVIGTGSAAKSIAHACREAGWSVAVADERELGGTCANRGCDPKRVLAGAAEAVDAARRLSGSGLQASEARIDWPALMRFKRTFTDPVSERTAESFRAKGIDVLRGPARFVSAEVLRIGDEEIRAKKFAVCSGAKPAKLGISGEDLLITSDDFLSLDSLPASLLFVGGGYVAFEFAHIACRAGVKVAVLHRGERPLTAFDPFLTDMLVEESRRIGIDIRLKTEVTAVERRGDGVAVLTAGGEIFRASAAVHAAGRPPAIGDLNLEAAGVESSRRGVRVNEFLQSVSNPNVYAAGDAAASGPPLTPVAGLDGRVAAKNLLEGNHARADYSGIASVVFTHPALASAGLTETEALEAGLDFDVHSAETAGWFTARRVREQCAGYKVLVERGTGRILGAHLLGMSAEENINVFALAIRSGLNAEQMKDTLYAYPTAGSNIGYMVG